jgi:hypothetical protein
MSVSVSNTTVPAALLQPTAPQRPVARDADHDGDNDAGPRTRAATPPGVGGLVDKDV